MYESVYGKYEAKASMFDIPGLFDYDQLRQALQLPF